MSEIGDFDVFLVMIVYGDKIVSINYLHFDIVFYMQFCKFLATIRIAVYGRRVFVCRPVDFLEAFRDKLA